MLICTFDALATADLNKNFDVLGDSSNQSTFPTLSPWVLVLLVVKDNAEPQPLASSFMQ